jgi:phosphohistidine phosphatase
MQIFIVRHGVAVEMLDADIETDAERWLTDVGIKRMEEEASGFQTLVDSIECIFTSPFLRAEQTANILAQAYSTPPPVEKSVLLKPGATLTDIEKLAQKITDDGAGVFVCHQPDCSQIISHLIGSRKPDQIEMRKGAVCRIDVDGAVLPGSGKLMWLLQPRCLRAVGK